MNKTFSLHDVTAESSTRLVTCGSPLTSDRLNVIILSKTQKL